jgi:hypothetical protein
MKKIKGVFKMQIPPIIPTYIPTTPLNKAANEVNEIDTECQACANRFYQDNSSDGGVSFQQPTRIHPNEAAAAVVAHEREHQVREARSAVQEGREVISNDIRIYTSVCDDCGRTYVSGGETRTVTRETTDEQPPMSMLDVFATRQI